VPAPGQVNGASPGYSPRGSAARLRIIDTLIVIFKISTSHDLFVLQCAQYYLRARAAVGSDRILLVATLGVLDAARKWLNKSPQILWCYLKGRIVEMGLKASKKCSGMRRATVIVYRYKVYDVTIDDFRHSTRMATTAAIALLGGVALPETGFEVYADFVSEDGWTEKDFVATPEHGYPP
jgi:hypothetical protein